MPLTGLFRQSIKKAPEAIMHMQNRKVPSQASSCSEPEYFWLTAEKFLILAQGMTRKNFRNLDKKKNLDTE